MLAPWIISHMPPHRIYVEPFGGGASVLMRKERSYAEVYNDIDDEIVNVFRVLQDRRFCDEFERTLTLTPFARSEFDRSYEKTCDAIERARRTIIRAYMGFGSDGHNADAGKTGFRANSNRSGTTPAHDWANYPKLIKSFRERLTGVVIENKDYWSICEQQDSPETLFFLDPPYVHDTRGTKHNYRFEMEDQQHEILCDRIQSLTGMVMLCGYENPIYDRLGWQTVKREAHADGARDRVEFLWMNPACVKAQSQLPLFSGVSL